MKNFKKVIAFLMVAAMTLGMGTVALADGETEATPFFALGEVHPAKAGETVSVPILFTADTECLGAYTIALTIDTTKVTFAVNNPAKIQTAFSGVIAPTANYLEEKSVAKLAGAFAPTEYYEGEAAAKAGDVFGVVQLTAVKDLAVGEEVVSMTVETATGVKLADGSNVQLGKGTVKAVVTEAPTTETTKATKATEATKATTKAAETTKAAVTTVAEIKTAEQALAALATLDQAVAAGAKLNKASFASEADYQAFVAAYEAAKKVLNNPNATAEEEAAALTALKTAMSKAKETELVSAAKAVVAPAATTAKAGNGKTGDTAPVAVLMLVAIAAFGTAVVVYRKKVNA